MAASASVETAIALVVVSDASVSAVLVGYDGPAEMMVRAVDSLAGQTLAPRQIICVDQSPDKRFAAVLGDRASVSVVTPARNLGYASACNLAADAATGEYVLFLNPDAHAERTCIEELVTALSDRHDAAIAGAQVLLPGGSRVNAGDNALHLSGLSWAGRFGLAREEGPPRSAAVASGAALLVRRSTFIALGGYTKGFFMYYDDVDLAWRARLRGWEVLFCPDANVVHDYEFIKGDYKWLWLERNRWWCLLAHLELRTLLALAPMLLAVEAAIWARALRERWTTAKIASYQALWQDRHRLRARRHEIQRSRAVPDKVIVEHMSAEIDSPFLDSAVARAAGSVLRVYRRIALALIRD